MTEKTLAPERAVNGREDWIAQLERLVADAESQNGDAASCLHPVLPANSSFVRVPTREDGEVRLWKPDGTPVSSFKVSQKVNPGGVEFSPDGRHLAIGSNGVELWTREGQRGPTKRSIAKAIW